MSKRASTAPVDISAVCQRLFAGDCLKLVAFDVGVSAAHLCKRVHEAGLAYTWTTAEERAALAALRAGTAVVVAQDEAAPALRLRERIAAALDEYSRVPQRDSARNAANRGAAPASSQPRTNRTAADRGVVTAALAQR